MRTWQGDPDSRRRWKRLIAVAVISIASPAVAQQVQLLVPAVDIGPVIPSTTVTQPSQTTTPLRIISDRYWQLSIVRVHAPGASEDIRVSIDGANWMPATTTLPVSLGTGPATSRQGVLVPLSIRIDPTFEWQPGRRQVTFQLLLNGSRADQPLRLTYEIQPAVALEEDKGHFDLTADHPSEQRDYDFNPRTYLVHSNVPWIMEIAPAASPSSNGPYRVAALADDGSFRDLIGRVTVSSGPATGSTGIAVPLRLRLHLADVPVAGIYSADVKVMVRNAADARGTTR